MSSTSQGLDVGKMALEGFGQVMDSMDLVKRAWSNFSLATPFTPTLSVEELDKRITELRAVEQWLALNQHMLRNTIQGLEVQRGTLDAINTMSKSFGEMTKPADDAMAQAVAQFAAAAAQKAAASPTDTASGAASSATGAFDWSPFAMPSSAFNWPTSPAPAAPGQETEKGPDPGAHPATAAVSAEGAPQADDSDAPVAAGSTPTSAPVTAMNPLAWWEMLQANFRQIAQAATGDAATGGTSGKPADRSGAVKKGGRGAGGSKARQSPKPARSARSARKAPAAGPAGPQKRRKGGKTGETG